MSRRSATLRVVFGTASSVRRPRLVAECGTEIDLHIDEWLRPVDAVEADLLTHLVGPVLDIGCGPGRVGGWLAGRGVPCLGVDSAPSMVSLACGRGGVALVRSVFDDLPATGHWGAAVLLDGNIGIGGDPHRLLTRIGELLRPGGRALVEVAAPGETSRRVDVVLDDGDRRSGRFAWATLSVGDVRDVARAAGARGVTIVDGSVSNRWFAEIDF